MKDFGPEIDEPLKDLLSRMLAGVQMVKRGLYLHLIYRLQAKYGKEKAKFLAAAVINTLFSDSPPTKKGEDFLKANKDLVDQEISNLQKDNEICNAVTQAVRVRGIISHHLDSSSQESLINALERLKELGVLVPGGETPEPDSFLSMAHKFQNSPIRKVIQGKEKNYEEGERRWAILTHKAYEYGTRGEYQKSIEFAEKAIQLNPRASEAWRLVGNAYEFLGDEMEQNGKHKEAEDFHRKATMAWDKAKKINPSIIISGYHK